MLRSVTSFIALLFAAVVSLTSAKAMAADSSSLYVDAQGNIEFPKGFRTSMVPLGSWFVPEGGASGFHDVYTEKESVFCSGRKIEKRKRRA